MVNLPLGAHVSPLGVELTLVVRHTGHFVEVVQDSCPLLRLQTTIRVGVSLVFVGLESGSFDMGDSMMIIAS